MNKYVLRMEFRNKYIAKVIYNQIKDSIISRDSMHEIEIEYSGDHDKNNIITVIIKYNSLLIPCMSFYKPIIEDDEYDSVCDYNMDIGIECPDKSDAFKIANFIHNQLCGLEDYINNKILLNFTDNMIRLFIDKNSEYYPFLLFIPNTLLLPIDNEECTFIENKNSNDTKSNNYKE